MTEPANGTEGWRPDPFGRHEVRFYDGHRWTPYVKDGETHGLDEPIEELVDPRAGAGMSLARSALLACLERLGPEPRRCVLLAYQGGFSYDELSTMLKRPTGTIKSWVHRSLQRLRACLEAE